LDTREMQAGPFDLGKGVGSASVEKKSVMIPEPGCRMGKKSQIRLVSRKTFGRMGRELGEKMSKKTCVQRLTQRGEGQRGQGFIRRKRRS